MCRCAPAVCLIVAGWLAAGSLASAQNDWQFPDPYFGALEVRKDLPARSRPPRVEPQFQPRPAAPAPTRPRPRFFRSRSRSAVRAPTP